MGIIVRAKSSISGLVVDLQALNTAIETEATTRATNDGDLSQLVTTEKTDLVRAINEVQAIAVAAGSSDTALQKAANLSDLVSVPTARTNLQVMSTTEVEAAITAAKLALGTNFTVADITARDLLTDLDPSDRVMVIDAGDSKWALYSPTTVDGDGKPEGWILLNDQNALENAMSAASIKVAYESNADTNAFTDAEKAKVGFLTVTEAIDLDDAVLTANLAQTIGAGAADVVPSTAAVKAAIDAVVSVTPVLENLVVAVGGLITLTNAPVGALNGVMNFGTVRYIDETGVAYDAPLVATAQPKEFTISTDTVNQWDTKTVAVQYLHA